MRITSSPAPCLIAPLRQNTEQKNQLFIRYASCKNLLQQFWIRRPWVWNWSTDKHSYSTCVRLVYVKVTCLPSFMVNDNRVWEKLVTFIQSDNFNRATIKIPQTIDFTVKFNLPPFRNKAINIFIYYKTTIIITFIQNYKVSPILENRIWFSKVLFNIQLWVRPGDFSMFSTLSCKTHVVRNP